MIELVLDNQPCCLLTGNGRADRSQPTAILAPDRVVKLDRQQLKDTGRNATEVNESFDSVYGLRDQHPGICPQTAGQITLGTGSDFRPGIGPKPVGKCSDQMFQHFESDLDLEPVSICFDDILRRQR